MPQADQRELKWVHLDDFTPGIADRDYRATGTISPWPLGTAVRANTYRCRALPSKALGPLPKRTQSFTLPIPGDLESGKVPTIVGFLIQGPVRSTSFSTNGYDEANWVVAREYYHTTHDASYRQFAVFRVRMWDVTEPRDTLISSSDAGTSGNHRHCFLESTRAADTDATLVGVPGFVAAWWGDGIPGSIWSQFPNPATPTSLTPKAIAAATYQPGPMVVYQGRSLIFNRLNYNSGDATLAFITNEQIFYTNSNLTTVASALATTFTPEDPGEIMAVAVSNANELFVLKRRHGAYVIRGDIVFPTALRVPGVMGAGKMPGMPCVTPIGVVYTSLGSGVYTWPGGEQSQCISDRLEPTNFDYQFPNNNDNMQDGHSGGRPDFFQDLIFVPPRWVYDFKRDSWWQLEDPADTNAPNGYLYFQKAMTKNAIIAARAEYSSGAPNYAYAYDFDLGMTSYNWRSHPIPVSLDTDIESRELVLKATGASGSTVIVKILANGATETHTFTLTGSNYPRVFRALCAIQGNDVQLEITADSNDTNTTAPTVYSIDLAYYEANTIPETTT